jgi:hypothetical protein
MAMRKALLWPDTHMPFHHVRACKLVIEIALAIKIDALYLLGDFADFYYINGHGPKHPGMPGHLKTEVDSVNSGLDTFDRIFPSIPKYYIQGNHENRLERYIQNKAPELFGLIDCQTLFKIQSRPGWRWIPYSPNQRVQILNSKLWARHEPLGASGKATASRALCSLAHGHDHQIHEMHMTGLDGQEHIVFGNGWLGDKRKDEVFGYVKNHHNWQLAFTLVYVDEESGIFYKHTNHILEVGNKLSCVVEGKRFFA